MEVVELSPWEVQGVARQELGTYKVHATKRTAQAALV